MKTPHTTKVDPSISVLVALTGVAWISIGFIFPQFGQTIVGQIWMVLGTIPILLGIWKINRIEIHNDYMIKRDCFLLRTRIIHFSNVIQIKITSRHLSSQPNFSIPYSLLKALGFLQAKIEPIKMVTSLLN